MKTQLYEAMQDERDKPKFGPHRLMEQWDATELRRAMLADAKKMKPFQERPIPKDRKVNQYKEHERREARVIQAIRDFGRPCTRREIAEALGISPRYAHDYVRPMVISNILTVDRGEDQALVYSLKEGQKLLAL